MCGKVVKFVTVLAIMTKVFCSVHVSCARETFLRRSTNCSLRIRGKQENALGQRTYIKIDTSKQQIIGPWAGL